MADDLLPLLTRFHREIVAPDIERIVGNAEQRINAKLDSHLDAIYTRFDRLETEYRESGVDSGPIATGTEVG